MIHHELNKNTDFYTCMMLFLFINIVFFCSYIMYAQKKNDQHNKETNTTILSFTPSLSFTLITYQNLFNSQEIQLYLISIVLYTCDYDFYLGVKTNSNELNNTMLKLV